jgi:HlyD family secretion protein
MPSSTHTNRKRRLLAGAGLVLVATVVTNPFGGSTGSSGGVGDNATATSLATVSRRSLSSQTQVSGTLGFAGSSSIRVPSGTAPSAVSQAQQSVANAEAMLSTARMSLAADSEALAEDRATASAARAKEAVDCAGEGAAESASSGSPASDGSAGGGSGGSGLCASDAQAATSGAQSSSGAAMRLTSDRAQVSSAEKQLASAQSSASAARASEVVYGQSSTFTALPAVGEVISSGQTLYAIGGRPVVLRYGSAATRVLPLGSVVFEPGPVRVTSVTPAVGQAVMPGPVLAVTSTARQVRVSLDAAQQASVKVGDAVTITLPDNRTTPGRITYVSSVATSPSSKSGGGSGGGGEEEAPTIEVDVTPTDPTATGRLDQAPVNVSITTESVQEALAVPIDALLALAGGGYALELAEGRVHRLEAVGLGLFDDADGLVQVSGEGVSAGQRVVVPATS